MGTPETILNIIEMNIEYTHRLLFYMCVFSDCSLFGERLGEHF